MGIARLRDGLHSETGFVRIPTVGSPEYAGKISWGEPAKICQVKNDKECICGNTLHSAEPLDLLYKGLDIIAGYCPACGFGFDLGASDGQIQDTPRDNKSKRPADS